MKRCLLIAAIATVFAVIVVRAENTGSQENTAVTVAYLLGFVAKSDYTFIRNGQSYTGKEASPHMKRKYQYFKDQIKTPEDFIRLAATESLRTGKPYMVKTKQGQELRCDEWMKKILKDYRQGGKEKREDEKDG